MQHPGTVVRGIHRQHPIHNPRTIIIFLGIEIDLGQRNPCGNKVGSLAGQIFQKLGPLFWSTRPQEKISVAKLVARTAGSQVRGRFELITREREIRPREMHAGQGRMSPDRFGIERQGLFERFFNTSKILLPEQEDRLSHQVDSLFAR